MRLGKSTGLFGSRTRSDVLLILSILEVSHASELARMLDVRLYTVQRALETLEQDGVIAGNLEGRTRRVRLDPRFYAKDQLRALLDKIALHNSAIHDKAAAERRRPRKVGKEL